MRPKSAGKELQMAGATDTSSKVTISKEDLIAKMTGKPNFVLDPTPLQ
jgi:hypothetical protein